MEISALLTKDYPTFFANHFIIHANHMKAILLAAGFSSRMGRLKQTMLIDGVPMVRRIAESLRKADMRVVVVLGHREADVQKALAGVPCEYVRNPAPESGMFASVQCGCAHVANAQGCLIMPGDCPGVQVSTITCIKHTLHLHPASVIIPAYRRRRGHPVGVPAHVVARIKALPPTTPGLRTLWHIESVHEVPVDDAAVLQDLDRPEDLSELSTTDNV